MKRILVLCTLLLCLALTAVLFASCDLTPDPAGDETTAPAHEHVWDEGTFTPGRCDPTTKETIENGKIVYTCSICGETKTEETDGHTWNDGKVIASATCAQTGQKLFACTVCDQRRVEKIPVNPNAHETNPNDKGRLVTPPTATKAGEVEMLCTICGKGVSKGTLSYSEYNAQVSALQSKVADFKTADFGGTNITTNLSAAAGKTYDATPVKPKAQHPRVMFNASEVAAVRETIHEKNNSAAIKLFLKALENPTTGKLPTSSAHNNFSSDVIDQIQALALDYQMTGNKISGYEAIYALKNHLITMDFAGITGDPERQYGYTMFTAACVYDWCYDLLTQTDKIQIVSGVEHKCCDDGKMEMGFPPSGQYSVAGHGCEFQLLRDYLAFAIAIYDDYPGWWDYIGGRFYAEYVEPRNYYYSAGMVTQGASLYVRIRFVSDLYSAILIKAATGVMPYDAAGMKQVMRTVYSYELPNGNAFAAGDDNLDDGRFTEYSRSTLLTSYLFEDATMRANLEYFKKSYSRFDSYYTVGSNYVEYLICSSNNVKAASNRHADMPLILYNGGFLGQIIARNNWGDTQAAVLMKIGVRTGGNHDHRDAGQFQIFYKTMLAGDTGDYDSYGSNHWKNYHQATIAHNCILIGGSGQQRMGGNEMSHRNYLTDSNTLIGEVTGHEEGYADAAKTQPAYAYIAGNNAKAYGSSVASEVTRRMLAVYDTKNANIPMYFFVFDNITSASSSAKKTFLLHVPAQPTISGKTVTVSKDGGKLVLQNVIGGNTITSVGGSGHNYDVDGTQCVSRDSNNNVITSDDGFWGRVEIKTASGTTNQLLNVMYVCDADKNPTGQTATEITGTAIKGAQIGKVAAVFVTNATRRAATFNFTASGSGELTYYVSGVRNGNWKVTDANGKEQTVSATKDGGLLVFTAAAGQITLTPQ